MSISLLFILRRRWPILVALPLLAAFTVSLISPPASAAPRYTAEEIVAVNLSGRGSFTQVQQAVFLVKQPEVAAAAFAIYDPDGEEPEDIRRFANRIRIVPNEASATLKFDATGTDPREVERYVGAFARAFVADQNERNEAATAEQLEDLQARYDEVAAELEAFNEANALALAAPEPDPLLVVQQNTLIQQLQSSAQAITDAVPNAARNQIEYRALGATPASLVADARLTVPQSRTTRAFLAGLFAFFLAIVLVALIERFNPRMDDRAITEEVAGVPVLAMVPMIPRKRRAEMNRPRHPSFVGPFAEAYRALRSHMDFLDATNGRTGSVVAVVSAMPADGKTITTAYLALAYQEAAEDVVALGCDFRRPDLHERFEVPIAPGFSTRRDPNNGVTLADLPKLDPVTGVYVVPSGRSTAHTTDLVPDVRAIANAGRDAGRKVVIDTAPVLVANEAVDMVGIADYVVLVVRAGRTTRRSVAEAMISLRLNQAKVVGTVMIGSLEASEASGYYYGYYDAADRGSASEDSSAANGAATTNGHNPPPVVVASTTADDESPS